MENNWWADKDNAQEWIKQNKKREQSGKNNTTIESQKIVISEIKKHHNEFNTILEVGAGDGRLIGNLSKLKRPKFECHSCDINEDLSKYVLNNYDKVNPSISDIINLPYEDNSFDLVFTYQVLQHIPPEEIEQALNELIRVSKKEVWCWEGIGRVDYEHGAMTHKAHSGSWVWHIDKFKECYSIEVPKNNKVSLDRQRLYKIKKNV